LVFYSSSNIYSVFDIYRYYVVLDMYIKRQKKAIQKLTSVLLFRGDHTIASLQSNTITYYKTGEEAIRNFPYIKRGDLRTLFILI